MDVKRHCSESVPNGGLKVVWNPLEGPYEPEIVTWAPGSALKRDNVHMFNACFTMAKHPLEIAEAMFFPRGTTYFPLEDAKSQKTCIQGKICGTKGKKLQGTSKSSLTGAIQFLLKPPFTKDFATKPSTWQSETILTQLWNYTKQRVESNPLPFLASDLFQTCVWFHL